MSPADEVEQAESDRRETPCLDDVFAELRNSNPFALNRVTEPSPYDVDVPAIHAASFKRLTELAEQAMRSPLGIGAVLLGGAGIGKSHLLSRLFRWANETTPAGGRRACYVYLHNVLADPDRMPRYLLKYVVSRLWEGGRGAHHQTSLFWFVDQAIRLACQAAGFHDAVSTKDAKDAFRVFSATLGGDLAAYEMLFQFWRHARPEMAGDPGRRYLASVAVAWLSGDEVDPEAAGALRLKSDGQKPVMLRDDHEVQQVLVVLARLAHVSKQPFILCIDQVDNIDPDKLRPLAQFLHAMVDHAANLLVITSGVKLSLLNFKKEGVIPEAAWDRIARYDVELFRISRQDARKILEARLERFHEPFMQIEAVRRHVHEDTLFPLGRAWLERRLEDGIDFRPRDILTWASDAWEAEQANLARLGGEAWIGTWPSGKVEPPPPPPLDIEKAIDDLVDRKIAEQVAQHRLQPGSLPPDAGNLAGLVETLLGSCRGDDLPYTFRGVERMKKKGTKLPPYDLLVRERREPDGREVTTGLLFVTNVGHSATAALRRLLQDDTPPDHRLLVTDEERRPLHVGEKGDEYYSELKRLGSEKFEHLKINFEQYAGLDALREVIGMARSGDLEIEAPRGKIRPVSETEVVASHHRQDRFRRHPLLCPLLTEHPPPPEPENARQIELDETDVRQYIMAQLAWRMGSTAQAMAKGYVEVMPEPRVAMDLAWPEVKAIVERLHAEGRVYAQPHDDDLFMTMRK